MKYLLALGFLGMANAQTTCSSNTVTCGADNIYDYTKDGTVCAAGTCTTSECCTGYVYKKKNVCGHYGLLNPDNTQCRQYYHEVHNGTSGADYVGSGYSGGDYSVNNGGYNTAWHIPHCTTRGSGGGDTWYNSNHASTLLCSSSYKCICLCPTGQTLVNGVCTQPQPINVPGCTAQTACNYDSSATQDDGSCSFSAPNHNCAGECTASLDCNGDCGGTALVDDCGVCDGSNQPPDNHMCTGTGSGERNKCDIGKGRVDRVYTHLEDYDCEDCVGTDHKYSLFPDYSTCQDHQLCGPGYQPDPSKTGSTNPGCVACVDGYAPADSYASCTGWVTCANHENRVGTSVTEPGTCEQKSCTCSNGFAKTGTECTDEDSEMCKTCGSGFAISGELCLTDTDGDNTADVNDSDDDGDGVADASDAFPLDSLKACKSEVKTGETAFAKGETKVLVCSGLYVGGGEATCTGGHVVKSWECTLKTDLSDPAKKDNAIDKIKDGIMKPGKKTSYADAAVKEEARKAAKSARRDQMKAAVTAGLSWKDLVVEDTNFEGFTDKVIGALGTGKAKYRTVFGASQTFEITPGSVLGSVPSGDLDFFDLDDGASITLSVTDETHTVFAEKSGETLIVKCNDVAITDTDEFVCGGRKWYISSLASGTGCVPNAALNVDGVCVCVSGYAGSPFDAPTQCLVDTDGDLTADVEDTDDDGDGVTDVRETTDVTDPLDDTDFNECSKLEEAEVAQAYIDGQCCKCQ